MKKTLLIGFLFLFTVACKNDSSKAETKRGNNLTIPEKIAFANGLKEFEQIEEMNYTFNVKRGDSLLISRSWEWQPIINQVTFIEADSTVSYNHVEEAAQHSETDAKFINDQYWLLIPYHLVWDEMEYEYEPKVSAPISDRSLQKLTVRYPDNVGYTPGDTYEIFFNDDFMIQEWIYISGSDPNRTMAATWEDYKEIDGMRFATMHRNKETSVEIFFTDISIE